MTGEGPVYRIRPCDLPPTIGFTVDVGVGWRSLEARFTPGSFAADLVRAMESSDAQQRMGFRIFAGAAQGWDKSGFPGRWSLPRSSLARVAKRMGFLRFVDAAKQFAVGREREGRRRATAGLDLPLRWAGRCSLASRACRTAGDRRGGRCRRRSRLEAVRAFTHQSGCVHRNSGCVLRRVRDGLRCDLRRGRRRVHPRSSCSLCSHGRTRNGDRSRRDLVPVCPNCHAMLHTSRPPLLPQELRAVLDKLREPK